MNIGIIPGLDFVCASIALAYVARFVSHQVSIYGPGGAAYSVAKVSLRDQHVARRAR
jgi:hypothetical protein